ncbi:cytidylate kinase family protein [Patescibacteria group bacterium]|nr:cytidylate kinase family protein [Patescibacteria group bacterium]
MKTYLKLLAEDENLSSKKKGLTITVSGLAGSGKSTVAKEIARFFNLRLINAGDLFREYAQEKNLPLDQVSNSLPAEIDYQIDKMTLDYVQKGECVVVGRLSAWVAGQWADCKIFVEAEQKIREERVASRDELTSSEAAQKVKNRDERDAQRYEKLYQIDLNDKSIYDLIIENNQISLEELKKQIIEKVKEFLKI